MAARRPPKRQRVQAKQRGTARAAGSPSTRRGAASRARARPETKAAARAKPKAKTKAKAAPRAGARPARRATPRRRGVPAPEPVMESLDALGPLAERPEGSTALTGGDLDADWQRAQDTGEEAVGGSVATPDQDVVDEIGRALGVEQEADREVWTSQDILGRRDRRYWRLEREAAGEDEA